MSKISVQTKIKRFPVEKNLYGIFFEDINRAGDGGLYPELLRNRTFEDSIPPKDCMTQDHDYALVTEEGWRDEFNHGEGLSRWIRDNQTPYTPIPAWYTENAVIELDEQDTLNKNRQVSLQVHFQKGGKLINTGFCGIPQNLGKSYRLLLFAKTKRNLNLHIAVTDVQNVYSQIDVSIFESQDYTRYEFLLTATGETGNGQLEITGTEGGELQIGYISLLPEETFMGHGLRTDIVQKLQALQPKFFRFPGGCIVEGFSPKTVMYFRNTVGPVWERPGHQLMWHYRTYTGIGFHEYLQLCEDLDMEPLYVFNCGMTCQARKSVLLTGDALEDMIQDTLDAVEYAIGSIDSKWGKLRAQMGHPEPFKMNYMEIGNENWGPDYHERYKLCYERILAKYPHITFIANEHVEKNGLTAPIVDEHYYNTAEFFAENTDYFDAYDRQGPKIFLGELSVVKGFVAQLYGALGEGAFLVGAERNQDIVQFISYAPLLENMNYSAWFPNLIRFNNRISFAIPAYYTWKMFGQNRGDMVVTSQQESDWLYRPMRGMASLMGKKVIRYRNAKWNGRDVNISHELMGHVEAQSDSMLVQLPDAEQLAEAEAMWQVDKKSSFVIFGEENVTDGHFDIDILLEEDADITIGIYSSRIPKEMYISDETHPPKEWSIERVKPFRWHIQNGVSTVLEPEFDKNTPISEFHTSFSKAGEYHHFSYQADGQKMTMFIDGNEVHTVAVPGFHSLASVVTDTEEKVIIKAVNLAPIADEIEITLDCEVEEQYTAHVLSGEQTEENTPENPEQVHDITLELKGAAKNFIYHAPAYSVNILVLNKN